jgi:hypothetical protein
MAFLSDVQLKDLIANQGDLAARTLAGSKIGLKDTNSWVSYAQISQDTSAIRNAFKARGSNKISADLKNLGAAAVEYARSLYLNEAVSRGVPAKIAARAAQGLEYNINGTYITVRNKGVGAEYVKFIENGTRPVNPNDFIEHAKARRIARSTAVRGENGKVYYFSGEMPQGGRMATSVVAAKGRPYLIVPSQAMANNIKEQGDFDSLPTHNFIGTDVEGFDSQVIGVGGSGGAVQAFAREGYRQSAASQPWLNDANKENFTPFNPSNPNMLFLPGLLPSPSGDLDNTIYQERDVYTKLGKLTPDQKLLQARAQGERSSPVKRYSRGGKTSTVSFTTLSPYGVINSSKPIKLPPPIPAFPVMRMTQEFLQKEIMRLANALT